MLPHPALLVVDELGYLPVTQAGATPVFRLNNARRERASTVLTPTKGSRTGAAARDEVVAAALIDRLLYHCRIVNIRGISYRMRVHHDLLRPTTDDRREGQHRERRPR